jgi:hypothetical protein
MDRQIALPALYFAITFFVVVMLSFGNWTHQQRSNARALLLLKEWLSPGQLKCYERHRYFEVVGNVSARVYRINYGTQANIEELDNNGRPVCRWCFAPEGDLVAGDVMLAQKIALETNERGAIMVANRTLLNEDRQRLS